MPNNEHPFNLRHLHQFKTPSVHEVYHDMESVSFLGPKIGQILSDSLERWKV